MVMLQVAHESSPQVDNRVFVSGQIGLIPASMMLPNPRSLADEIALSLQHIGRISNAMPEVHDGKWRGVCLGLVAWVVHEQDIPAVKKGLLVSEARKGPFILDANGNHPQQFQASPGLIVVPNALPKGALVEMQAFLHNCQGRPAPNIEDAARLKVDNQLVSGDAPDSYTIQIGGFREVSDAIAFIVVKRHGTHFLSFSTKFH